MFDQLVRFVPDVSGADIVAEGNHPEMEVFYTTSNGVNEQHAPQTLVNVHVDPLIELDAPKILHTLLGGGNYLTCASLPAICHGVRWLIPADSRMREHDQVELFWQGFSSNAWENPIDDTDFQRRESLTAEHLENGVAMVVLPWETKIEPMRVYASATAQYFLYRGGALVGQSKMGRVRIDRVSPGSGKVCQPGDPGFCDGTDLQWLDTAAGNTV
ncbi:hypothetical protein AAHI06_15610 [Pseudomonas salmasensis]|uniref:hypothetical protein n=1 Tax=Pseudomonas salmasensis TaxID=2745514 RepID=UPI00321BD543